MSTKKRRRKLESFAPLTLLELKKLPTPRILAYLKTLHQCEGDLLHSDFNETETIEKGVIFKNSKVWKSQYALVKKTLATRENIE